MIAIHPHHREFRESNRLLELMQMESRRLASMRKQYAEDIREQFHRSQTPKRIMPSYPDYVGDFRKDKDPVNYVLGTLYSEEI